MSKEGKKFSFVGTLILALVLAGCASAQQAGGNNTGNDHNDTGNLSLLLRQATSETQKWGVGRDVKVYSLDIAKKDELFQAVQEAGFYQVGTGEGPRDWDLGKAILHWCVSPNTEKWDNELQISDVGEKTVHTYFFKPLPKGFMLVNDTITLTGDTVKLTSDFRVEKAFVVPEGVTLDLTGGGGLWLTDGITLTVNGTVNAPSNKIGIDNQSGHSATINGSGTIYLKSKGSLLNIWGGGKGQKITLDGVTLVGLKDNNSPLIEVNNGGEFVMKSGVITENIFNHGDWADGGGVKVIKATFTMNGGEISGNVAKGNRGGSGGGVNIGEGSVFTMTDGTISGNTCTGDDWPGGGGVNVWKAIFTMSGGEISGNAVKGGRGSNGGGVSISEGSLFTMSGGTITSNSTNGFGGGVNVGDGAIFTMQGGTISGNTGERNGGVWIQNRSAFIMEGGTIYGKVDSLPARTDASLANSNNGGDWGVSLGMYNNSTVKWGTGGTYTKGGVLQTGGSDIAPSRLNNGNGITDDTLIAIPRR